MLSYSHFKDPVFDPGFILIVNGYSQSHQRVLFFLAGRYAFPARVLLCGLRCAFRTCSGKCIPRAEYANNSLQSVSLHSLFG